MKRRSLSDLICHDLSKLARIETDVVASEESIRTMITMFRDKGLLKNVNLVHKEHLEDFLTSQIMNTPGHYQFIIEVGQRSKARQWNWDTIHYCALDLYIRPDKKPLAFVADHYRGYSGYYNEFSVVSKTLGIQFVIAGGSVYQADEFHCPMFTIMHLIQSTKDDQLLDLLDSTVEEQQILAQESDEIQLNWNKLPPEYVFYSQSVSMLFKYIDAVKDKENLSQDEPSSVLVKAKFAKKLSATLFPINSSDSIIDQKLRNKAIKYLAAKYAGEVVIELEKVPVVYDETRLIDICYKDKYPRVYQMLSLAIDIQNAFPQMDGQEVLAHPLFELAFYHADVLELCLKNKSFNKIFNDGSILILMQKGLLDPYRLFAKLALPNKEIELIAGQCKLIAFNLEALVTIIKSLDKGNLIDEDELMSLLTSPKTKNFFQNSLLTDLFCKGLISAQMVEKIVPYQIKKEQFKSLSDEQQMTYLKDKFSLGDIEEGMVNPDFLEEEEELFLMSNPEEFDDEERNFYPGY